MHIIVRLLLATVAVAVAAYLIPGVVVANVWTALVVAVVLGVLYAVLRPILVVLTLPVTVLSFGLFLFVINSLLVLLAARLVPGFGVSGFWTALLFSLVVSIVGGFLNALA